MASDATPLDLRDPAGYAHWVRDRVRFSDTDALGHVNNVAFAAYCETGRAVFGYEIGWRDVAEGQVFVLRALNLEFLGEAWFPQRVDIGSRITGVGRTSYDMANGVFVEGRCVATATSTLVLVTDGRPTPLEGALRARFEQRLG